MPMREMFRRNQPGPKERSSSKEAERQVVDGKASHPIPLPFQAETYGLTD